MCSSGGQIAQTDQALQTAQAKMTNTLEADYGITFAQQQAILGQQRARLNFLAANPLGYSVEALHTAKASINDNTARAAKQAIGAAAAYSAAHGSADIGGGATGQMVGEIASEAAQSKAGELASLSSQNEEMKQKNFWNAISGLNQVASDTGSAGSTAIGSSIGTADSAVTAGSGALAAKQAGWQNFAGVMGGISGLATAASGFKGLHG